MLPIIIMFLGFIFKIVKWYLFTILPILIIISIICVLLGMCIRSGLKGGIGLIIIIITIVIFIYVVYGKDATKILLKIKDKIKDTYFSGKQIFTNPEPKETTRE